MTDQLAESTRRFYDTVARRNPELPFLNYGFADPADTTPLDPGASELVKVCRRLYEEVLTPFPAGLGRVVEIGCGRGGGAFYLLKEHSQLQYLGLDLSREHIRVCRERFAGSAKAQFAIANANGLPLPQRQFDAAFSVEACHHFGDLDSFFRGVARALKPGGWFFLTGLFRQDQPQPEPSLVHGFEVLERQDISANVVASLARTSDLREALVTSMGLPERFTELLMSWAGVKGFGAYQSLESGLQKYLRFRLRRT